MVLSYNSCRIGVAGVGLRAASREPPDRLPPYFNEAKPLGIGRPTVVEGSTEFSDDGIMSYVLSDFTPEEKRAVAAVIPTVSDAILCLLNEGLSAAMNKYN